MLGWLVDHGIEPHIPLWDQSKVAEAARPLIREFERVCFQLDNNIDLRSETNAAKNYEIGTIAHVALASDELPDDATIQEYLEALLVAYGRLIETPPANDDAGRDIEPPALVSPQAERYNMDDALEEMFLDRENVERCIDVWRSKKNLILQGVPGVGKSFISRRLAYTLIGFCDDSKVQAIQLHQSYSYEDFVQGYCPDGSGGFERRNGIFYEFLDRVMLEPDGTFVFIMGEINRGNLSKILGELMLLIEPDKRDPSRASSSSR